MTHLPVLDRTLILELVTAGLPAVELNRRAEDADLTGIWERLFGPDAAPGLEKLKLDRGASVRDLYAAILESDSFRAACGRISASYGW